MRGLLRAVGSRRASGRVGKWEGSDIDRCGDGMVSIPAYLFKKGPFGSGLRARQGRPLRAFLFLTAEHSRTNIPANISHNIICEESIFFIYNI